MQTRLTLIAATAFGLEAVVKRELAALGYAGRVVSPGRIQFDGGVEAICRANLWLRTADRVLLRAASFPAPDFDALFESTKAIRWEAWIPPDARCPVVGRSAGSQLTSVPACQRAVKRAIVESLLRGHSVSELPETGPLCKVQVALHNDVATLTIDTTGPSLHKRGYRRQAGEAPLKETLAAALVQLSFWNPERPLLDPFCGSGTIPIEAALLGRNLAPGLSRGFAAEDWPMIGAARWSDARSEARDLARPPFEERLVGTDVDPRALAVARAAAEAAGVAENVHFQQRPFENLSSNRRYGCLIANPPYGERLGEQRGLAGLYASMPVVLRKLPTWSHYILTAYPGFEGLVGRTADRRRKLYNGRIECTYYQFHGPRPSATRHATAEIVDQGEENAPRRPAEAQQPVFGGLTEKADEQAEIFANRLRKLARHRRRWPTRRGITCYRLYERDVPEVPLVVDRYEDHLHIGEYQRPHDRDPAQHANWLDLMVRTAAETLEVDRRRVFFKRRRRQSGSQQHEHLAQERYEIIANEGGLKFHVNLSDYVDTGLFLDHRVTRSLVRDAAEGKRFLNLFGYTGAFTVYAAAGGAASTTTVDWSHSYIDWAQRNLELNNLAGPQHAFVREDARQFLCSAADSAQYDLAVVDPPTFSNSKRTEDDWNIQDGYAELLRMVLGRMSPGGIVYFSTNFRRFKFDETRFDVQQVREISKQTVPEDFRNRRIHRCWRIVAR